MKKLYTYIITADSGSAPCYDNNIYTLACCKPQIRRMIYKLYSDEINSDFWVMGIQRDKENNNKPFIVYLAKITKVIKLEDYYNDKGEYASRFDCKYRGVKTVDNLPIAMDSGGLNEFIKYFSDIKSLSGNPHGEFDNTDDLKKLTKGKLKDVMKDICGRAVLLSDNFIHTSQIDKTDKYALTNKLGDCFKELLEKYNRGTRIYHLFDNWREFDEAIKNIKFDSKENVVPFNTDNNCCCCSC